MIFNSILDSLFIRILCILFKSSILENLLWHQASGSAILLLPGGGEGPCFWLSVCWHPRGGRSPSLLLGRVEVQIPHQGPLTSPWGILLLLTWPALTLRERNHCHWTGMKILASLTRLQRWCGCLSVARWSTSLGTASPVTLWGWLHLFAAGQSEI